LGLTGDKPVAAFFKGMARRCQASHDATWRIRQTVGESSYVLQKVLIDEPKFNGGLLFSP
jgi:hypothetical protein